MQWLLNRKIPTMKRYLVSTALAAALLVPGTAMAQTATAPATQQMMATTATEFVPMAAYSNRFEIESSELALERAQSAGVRTFAEHMVRDHTAAGESMMQAVAASGADVAVPAGLDARHQQMVDQLQGLNADQFDAAYLQMQRQAHDEAVALFEGYAENGETGPIREFAANTLPVLREHRQMLTSTDGTVTSSTGAAATTTTGAMSSDQSGSSTARSGEIGADPAEAATPSGGVVPGQSPN
jgi:putative membrane protein